MIIISHYVLLIMNISICKENDTINEDEKSNQEDDYISDETEYTCDTFIPLFDSDEYDFNEE